MKVIKKILVWVTFLLFGVLVGLSLPYKWNADINEVALFSFDDNIWEKIFDVVNAFLLLATLLTAIFKEQILAGIYHAKFEVKSETDYQEIVENTEMGSRANYYEKVVKVHNTGNRPALNSRLVIDGLFIKGESDYSATEIELTESIILPQSIDPSKNQLKPQGVLSFSMFRILPKVSAHGEVPARPMSFQIGNNEVEIKQGKTDYTITFHIEAEDIQSPTNKVVVHWNGKWQNRKTEMIKELTIEHI